MTLGRALEVQRINRMAEKARALAWDCTPEGLARLADMAAEAGQ